MGDAAAREGGSMIEPKHSDRGRRVQWRGSDGAVAGTGVIENFSIDYVYVRTAVGLVPTPRHQLEWVAPTPEAQLAARLEAGRAALAKAARSVFDAASMAIELVDEHTWQVGGCLFQPALGCWRRQDGMAGTGGARALVMALRAEAAAKTAAAEPDEEPKQEPAQEATPAPDDAA
jgi:hypothetical protein